ncbi:MAG TPA: cupin domain-containing protein [Gemmatimonadota bacterium]|nr:cupin domain-containing protein [Gemmatimonadota bacterium]
MLSRTPNHLRWTLLGLVAVAGLLPTTLAGQGRKSPIRLVDMTDAQRSEAIGQYVFSPTDLSWLEAPSMPGVKLAYIVGDANGGGEGEYTYRLKFPAGYELRPNTFPKHRFVTVIQGTAHMGFGERANRAATTTLGAGSYLMIPPRTPVFGWTDGETIIQVHGKGPYKMNWVGKATND